MRTVRKNRHCVHTSYDPLLRPCERKSDSARLDFFVAACPADHSRCRKDVSVAVSSVGHAVIPSSFSLDLSALPQTLPIKTKGPAHARF